MNATIEFRFAGESRSFPDGVPGSTGSGDVRILILAGVDAQMPSDAEGYDAVLIELGNECLAARATATEGRVFGFTRFRLGTAAPTDLVELVKGEVCDPSALDLAVAAFTELGLQVSVCADRVGRIVDRLIRPQFNIAFAAQDAGLATRDAIEACVRRGLGYRQGLLDAVEKGGLEDHCEVSSALFQAYGQAQFAPARQAIVAHQRRERGR